MKTIEKACLIVILLLPAIWLAGCSQKTTQQETSEPVPETDSIIVDELIEEDSVVDRHEYQLGIDALSVRDYAAAKTIFGRFIEKNPELSGAYLNLAFIAYHQQQHDTSERLVERVLEINPQHDQAYHLRALLHQHKGDIHAAEKDYIKAINLNPRYTLAHYNLALLYDIFLQKLPLAIEHYSIYLELLDREDQATVDWVQHLKNSLANG